MGEWKETSFNEIAIINPSETIVKEKIAKKIAMELLQPFTKRISSYSLEPYNGGMKFKNGDTIVARITPCLENGKTAYVDILDDGEVGFGSTEYIVIREKEGISDKHFLYYFSISPEFREIAILSMTGSSGRQRVQTEVVKDHYFLLPPLPEQKAIASVLSSLDDKIDLLHRQNRTLEAMAEALFRQWFRPPSVPPKGGRMGIPGPLKGVKEEPDSLKGENNRVDSKSPLGDLGAEGWEEDSLLQVIELVGGGTPKTVNAEYWDGDIPWLAGGDIASSHKSFVLNSEKRITKLGLNNSSAKLLPKYSTVISARGTVGKYCILAKPMAFSQSNYGILPRMQNCYFFSYLLINHVVEELQSSAYGSVFDTITTNTFRDVKIAIPTETVILEFESQVAIYFKKVIINIEQIRTLGKLRDTLLPKLMSGEVRVEI